MAKDPVENTSEFDLGDLVAGKKFANFEHDFKGIVEKIYEHSLLVVITENDPKDDATVNEYNHRAVLGMSNTKILVKLTIQHHVLKRKKMQKTIRKMLKETKHNGLQESHCTKNCCSCS